MIFCFSVSILLNGNSTTTAPVVSKRPCKATLVMPPARSSTEMSMPHRWSAIHSGAVLAVFPWRRNAQTVPVQKISDRFSGKELTLRGRAACPGRGAVRSEGQRCAADGTVPLRGGPGSAVHRYALLRAAPHPGQDLLGAHARSRGRRSLAERGHHAGLWFDMRRTWSRVLSRHESEQHRERRPADGSSAPHPRCR